MGYSGYMTWWRRSNRPPHTRAHAHHSLLLSLQQKPPYKLLSTIWVYVYIAIAVPWQVALFVLLQRFKFTLHPGHVVDLKAKIILTPKYGMVMDIADR